ncbi:cytochrome o ubiquinol oxidase operon protein cyoD [Paenibacillus sp. 1_12]|uniref:cytochrome o ubiquinol oxidase subunit IV n=1 Tax=Paenibacillus sp. 1_12 TaxID=1566278 RepID=UPI0008F03398|nr:cytochrome o ubiquinol oxidase subunit IV [Paenibacillus sp. 1_12]SFM14459.1 cytochrome o ubiquinol oxidase operon protein cyoD [Paenibacillus sp. 1_12]
MDNHSAEPHHDHGGSLKSYTIGFILSIVLTIIPLVLVMNHMLNATATLVIILLIAILQFAVQMIFFMHIREEQKPRYNLMALILGLVILVTIVSGSVWIMTYNTVAH